MPELGTPEYFWSRGKRVGFCLEFDYMDRKNGYGALSFQGQRWRAHRLAWTLSRGPIPAGLFVCHTCDNRRCIEPLHLYLGTHRDNMRDAFHKGRCIGQRGELGSAARLTEAQVRAIRVAHASGASYRALARQYGVAPTTIKALVLRRTWTEVA
jgi:hypothetical protein